VLALRWKRNITWHLFCRMNGENLVEGENLSKYWINKLQHGKCFVRYLRTRCFCIRKLVRKYCTHALSMNQYIYYELTKRPAPSWLDTIYLSWMCTAPVSQSSWVHIPFKPEFFSGFNFTATISSVYNCDDHWCLLTWYCWTPLRQPPFYRMSF